MNPFTPLVACANPEREMPEHTGARLDAAATAIRSLRDEQRRLERLGFEIPIARCHDQVRFWSFVHNVCSLESRVSR